MRSVNLALVGALAVAGVTYGQQPPGDPGDPNMTTSRLVDMRAHGAVLAREAPDLFDSPALIEATYSLAMVRAVIVSIVVAGKPCSTVKLVVDKGDLLLVGCDLQKHLYAVSNTGSELKVVELPH